MQSIHVSRYEYKYLVHPSMTRDVRQFLLHYCEPDRYAAGQEWYGIRSLYLDTPTQRFFRQSVEKEQERLKLRVRGYCTGGGPVKLEIKRRVGDVVKKESLLVSREVWALAGEHGEGEFHRHPATASSEFLRLVESLRASPKVLVEYERQAFFSEIDDYVRITFDRRIRCQSMTRWSLEPATRLWIPVDDPPSWSDSDSVYVLELKFKLRPPAWLRDMVLGFGLDRKGFSKFARAVPRLGQSLTLSWDRRPAALQRYWMGRLA